MLIHKSVHVRREVWQKLRLHSEMSGVPLRDFLTYLIEVSKPVSSDQGPERDALERVAEQNRNAKGKPAPAPRV